MNSISLGSDEESTFFKSGLLGKDGLPPIGRLIQQDEPYYWYYFTLKVFSMLIFFIKFSVNMLIHCPPKQSNFYESYKIVYIL